MSKAITNKNGDVVCRYEIFTVEGDDQIKAWTELGAYMPLGSSFGNAKFKKQKFFAKVPLMDDWEENYLRENDGFNCSKCRDHGMIHTDEGFSDCDQCELGRLGGQYDRYCERNGIIT